MKAIPFTGAVALAIALPAAPAVAQDFQWAGTVAQGGTVEIIGVNGEIDASLSSDGRVHVTADKRARRSDEASVRIEVIEHSGGVTICALYPTPRRADRENECRPGGGRNSVNDNDVQVDFTVRVPQGVRLDATTVNGAVDIDGLRSDVEASTVNGNLRVRTTGSARASTVNGDLSVLMGTAPTRDAKYSTVNGSIELGLPAEANVDIEASTVNGSIDSDFDVTVRGRFNSRSMEGRIGDGGADLELSTVNGGIRLRRL